MCELFAMSSREPATITFSMHAFARHGSWGANRDGWGIGYYRDRAAQTIREPKPASGSPMVDFLQRQEWSGQLFLSHLRRAHRGPGALGRSPSTASWAGARTSSPTTATCPTSPTCPSAGAFGPWSGRPTPSTSSATCWDQLEPLYESERVPELSRRLEVVARFAGELRRNGIANFLYCDGDAVFAHAHLRLDPRQADALVPGLYSLQRSRREPAAAIAGPAVEVRTGPSEQNVCLLASVPLTDEDWAVVEEGEVLAVRRGVVEPRAR